MENDYLHLYEPDVLLERLESVKKEFDSKASFESYVQPNGISIEGQMIFDDQGEPIFKKQFIKLELNKQAKRLRDDIGGEMDDGLMNEGKRLILKQYISKIKERAEELKRVIF